MVVSGGGSGESALLHVASILSRPEGGAGVEACPQFFVEVAYVPYVEEAGMSERKRCSRSIDSKLRLVMSHEGYSIFC